MSPHVWLKVLAHLLRGASRPRFTITFQISRLYWLLLACSMVCPEPLSYVSNCIYDHLLGVYYMSRFCVKIRSKLS